MARTAILYVAERCNQSCVFCLEEDGSWSPFVDPSTLEVQATIDRLWERGARHITFMGGETFFRKDLGRIIAHARDVGFTRVGVTTNGTVLSKPGFLSKLVESGLAFIELSIHGHTPELANTIGGTHFTFERQAAAMAELNELGLLTIVNVVVCRENKDHLVDIARYVQEGYPNIPARFKFKLVSLLGLAASNAKATGRALAYSEVDFIGVGDYLAARETPFWFYNVPLCRLGAHAKRSLELLALVSEERYFDLEHRSGSNSDYFDSGFQIDGRVWPEGSCAPCSLRPVCPGLEETHRLAAGSEALAPRHDDPLPLARWALEDAGADSSVAEARIAARRQDPRPTRFVRARPDGALRFHHADEPDPLDVLLDERTETPKPSFVATPRFLLSYRNGPDGDPAGRPRVSAFLTALGAELARIDDTQVGTAEARSALARFSIDGWECKNAPVPARAPERRGALPLLVST